MEEVRRLRLKKGWNQNELAFHADLAPSVISLLETGKREPNATTLRKLADALEVEIPDLFRRPESPKAPGPAQLELEQSGANGEGFDPELDTALAKKIQEQFDTQRRVLRERQSIARSDEDLHEAAKDFKNWWLFTYDLLHELRRMLPEARGPQLAEVESRVTQAVNDEAPKDAVNPRDWPDGAEVSREWSAQQNADV